MKRSLLFIIPFASALLFSQDITSTLGSSGTFIVENASGIDMLRVGETGNASVYGSVTVGDDGSGQYTLPNTDGANGQVLTTNGSGTVGWTSKTQTVGVYFLICVNGQYPSSGSNASEFVVGQVIMFAGSTFNVPQNFMICDGRTLDIASYTTLYSVLGTRYGGNGTTNFVLPNIQVNTTAVGGGG